MSRVRITVGRPIRYGFLFLAERNWSVLRARTEERNFFTPTISSISSPSESFSGLTKLRAIVTRSGALSTFTRRDAMSDTSSCAKATTGNKPGSFTITVGNE